VREGHLAPLLRPLPGGEDTEVVAAFDLGEVLFEGSHCATSSYAIRGHLAELGIVPAKGRSGIGALLEIIADARDGRVPPVARGIRDVLARQFNALGAEIGSIDRSILAWHRSCEASRRLEEIPGIGPIVAAALVEIGES
jgi:transposase